MGPHPFQWAPAGFTKISKPVLVGANGQTPTNVVSVPATTQASKVTLTTQSPPPKLQKLALPAELLQNPALPNFLKPQNSNFNHKVATPVRIDRLESLLLDYDHSKINILVLDFTQGFKLECQDKYINLDQNKPPTHPSQLSHFNHDSVLRHADIVTDKLHQESAAGHMAGPYSLPPLSDFQVSPLALVEKKAKGSFRLIHNLSYPEGESVNEQIEKYKGSVKYQLLMMPSKQSLPLALAVF